MRRDIVRALRLIGERKAALARNGGLRLAPPEGNPGETLALDAAAVRAMVSEGLLERLSGTVARTPEGRAYLRRALSGGGDAFQAQHRATEAREVGEGEAARRVTVNAAESPLAWLATRRDKAGRPLITAEERTAGERLHRDYARGHRRPRVGQSWDPTGVRADAPAEALTLTEAAEDGRRRVERALAAVGPGLAEVLVAVCCEELGLEAVEARHGWPPRSAKVVLRLALGRLAAHYGIAAAAEGRVAAPLVHWGAPGYRPRA